MKNIRAMILAGEGINCEEETGRAFLEAGIEPTVVFVQEWKRNPKLIHDYQILVLPGGFSYGDELHSGQILALDLKFSVGEELKHFIARKGLILGICNGFQILMKLGIFEESSDRNMTLFHNESFQFQNQWVTCEAPSSKCVWTKGLSKIHLPVRHGEGRVIFKHNEKQSFEDLVAKGQVALTYDKDINGSYGRIAGLTDSSGQVLGLMPHPEAALNVSLYPKNFHQDPKLVLTLFTNARHFIQENL